MKHMHVASSQIQEIGYDEGTLEIHFHGPNGGSWYRYFDVPVKAFNFLYTAESIGSTFSKTIKGMYDYERFTQEEETGPSLASQTSASQERPEARAKGAEEATTDRRADTDSAIPHAPLCSIQGEPVGTIFVGGDRESSTPYWGPGADIRGDDAAALGRSGSQDSLAGVGEGGAS